MEIEGKIIQDLGYQEGVSKAGNAWKKQEWLLETMGQYPRKVKFTVFGETRVDQLKFVVGENYRISVDIESRSYNDRWYTDVNAYAASKLDGSMPGVPPQAAPYGQPAAPAFGQPAAPAAQPGFSQPVAGQSVDPFAGDANNTDDLPF